MRHPLTMLAACAAAALALAGCAGTAPVAQAPAGPLATAEIRPASGSGVSGQVALWQEGEQVSGRVQLRGLTPNAEHGFHVHERGDCSAPDATSAGAHLNPDQKPHGPPDGEHHAGDLPALKADASGQVDARFRTRGTLMGAGAAAWVGKALVVHAQPDDYRSQPAGNAGARIGCGVVLTPTGQGRSDAPAKVPSQM